MKSIKITSLLCCLLLLFAGCKTQKTAQEEVRVENVSVQKLVSQEISRVLELSTTLEGYETMSVAPSLTGHIEHIYVDVASRVRAGDTLVRMDQNQYNTTKLTFSNLQIEMQRMDALKQSGSVSQQAYDQTKLSYDQTKESLNFLKDNTFVKAKFSGVISAKNYEDGELYSGQPILTLTKIATLKTLINVPESYFPKMKRGMTVDIRSNIYPDSVFPATVEEIYPTIDPASHTFQVKVRIPNGSEKLRPGMYAYTSVALGNVTVNAIPFQCVQRLVGSNERYIYLNDNGIAKRIFIKLGQRYDDLVEVISDEVKIGDEVVTEGAEKIVDGTKLNIVKK